MKRYLLVLVPALVVVGLVVAVGFAKGHDPDDLRARARQMQDLAELLESQGDKEVAGHLAELAEHLHHKAEQLEGELRIRSKQIHHKELHGVVGELRKEMLRLRRDMDRLAHHVRELSRER